MKAIALDQAKQLFAGMSKKFTDQTAKSLDLIVTYQGKDFPSNGAILLFGKEHQQFFPDALVKMGRFEGITKAKIIDQKELIQPLAIVLEDILAFINRHTSTASEITRTKRHDTSQYPPVVVREAVINALLHSDYSMKGTSIQIAIFDDRIEITNPGALLFGLSMETALSGISQLRNRVIGHVFRELNLIERWGSGLGRMIEVCREKGIKEPKFEELDRYFRVTLFHEAQPQLMKELWKR